MFRNFLFEITNHPYLFLLIYYDVTEQVSCDSYSRKRNMILALLLMNFIMNRIIILELEFSA